MRVTIRDIALQAGVSVAAVSKVLNDYPDIGAETRQRVLRIVRELRYVPRASAQRLVTGRSQTIGVYYKSMVNGLGLRQPFVAQLLNAVKEHMTLLGYDMLLFGDSSSPHYQWELLDRAQHREIDGLMLLGTLEEDMSEILKGELPIVGLDVITTGPRAGFVISDNEGGMVDAVHRAVAAGYKRIGLFYGPLELPAARDRARGFYRGMRESGMPICNRWIVYGGFDFASGTRAAGRLMEQSDLPEVILCTADISAIGAMRTFQEAGLSIPKDVAIVGFDDIDAASYVYPSLTTVAQDTERIGQAATDLLMRLMNSPVGSMRDSARRVQVPTTFVARQSTRNMV